MNKLALLMLILVGCGPSKQHTVFMSSCLKHKAEFECIYLWKVANNNCSKPSTDMAVGVAAGLAIGGGK